MIFLKNGIDFEVTGNCNEVTITEFKVVDGRRKESHQMSGVKAQSICRPSRSILDPAFKYTPSHSTNLAETFKRVRESLS
jgi:hypothetical protein